MTGWFWERLYQLISQVHDASDAIVTIGFFAFIAFLIWFFVNKFFTLCFLFLGALGVITTSKEKSKW